MLARDAHRARAQGGDMAGAFLATAIMLLPIAANAAINDTETASMTATAGFVPHDVFAKLRGYVPQTHFAWMDLGRTLLLHVDSWILIAVAYVFARRLTQNVADRKLRRVKAAMAYARHRDASYTSVETGMLEWINHLLRHEWRSVVSSLVDKNARATLETSLLDVNALSGGLIRRAVVEEVTLGVVPPDLRLYASRYNPAEDYLQFEFDFRWDTVSSHILIKTDFGFGSTGSASGSGFLHKIRMAANKMIPTVSVPVHVTDVSISGKLLFGVRLSERAPGIAGFDVSFDGKPDVSVSVRPAGIPVSDVPGVRELLEAKIADVFAASYVEPERYYHDVERVFLRWFLDAGIDSGPGGFGEGGVLVVDCASAARLPATNAKNATSNPYLEVTCAGITKRTPTRLATINPDWSVRLAFPFPFFSDEKAGGDEGSGTPGFASVDSGKAQPLRLRLRVMDWSPLDEPRCIGSATHVVDVNRLLRSRSDASTKRSKDFAGNDSGGALGFVRTTVPLRGTRGGFVRLHLGVVAVGPGLETSLGSPREGSGRFGNDRFDPGARGSSSRRREATDAPSDDAPAEFGEDAESLEPILAPSDSRCGDESFRESSRDEASDGGAIATTVSRGSLRDRVGVPAGVAENSSGSAAAAARLMRLARLQKQRRDETATLRLERDGFLRRLEVTRESLVMETERRKLELRRALTEGAPFTVHTRRKPGFEPGKYRVWYVAARKHVVWAKGEKPGSKPKLHQFVPVSLIKECVPGTDAFTFGSDADPARRLTRDEAKAEKASRGRSRRGAWRMTETRRESDFVEQKRLDPKRNPRCDPARCFSLVLWKPNAVANHQSSETLLGSGAAGMGLATVDLELPEGGNGRGVREWCDAILQLAEENGGGAQGLDDDDDDDMDADEVVQIGAKSKLKSKSSRLEKTVSAVATAPCGDLENEIGDDADASDVTPLRRVVSLPNRESDDDDPGGEMMTIPIPPDSMEENRGSEFTAPETK